MSSPLVDTRKVFLFLTLFPSFLFYLGNPTEFLVGGVDGWAVPKNDEDFYNEWASKNRFKVNDTVHFKYKKDSVMVVTEEEYKKCRSAHPIFFANNEDTVFKLDRPGLFYFISGVNGHCDRGERMVIKVLEPESPPQSGNDTSPTNNKKNGAVSNQMTGAGSTVIVLLGGLSFLGLLLA